MLLERDIDLGCHRKIVIIGESGSGKTELALNLALAIREHTSRPLHFLDMDQTKPLFRARDVAEILREHDIVFKVRPQFMDAPVVPHGVSALLKDQEPYVLLDVGGNQIGALCLGQYAQELEEANVLVLYTINCYRSFSNTTQRVQNTMEMISTSSSLGNFRIVSNPYLGSETSAKDILSGNQRLETILAPLGKSIFATAIPGDLWEEVAPMIEGRCFPIRPFLSGIPSRRKTN